MKLIVTALALAVVALTLAAAQPLPSLPIPSGCVADQSCRAAEMAARRFVLRELWTVDQRRQDRCTAWEAQWFERFRSHRRWRDLEQCLFEDGTTDPAPNNVTQMLYNYVSGTVYQFGSGAWDWLVTPFASDANWLGPSSTFPLTSPGITIAGLAANTGYDVEVDASNTSGAGPFATATFSTRASPPPPPLPPPGPPPSSGQVLLGAYVGNAGFGDFDVRYDSVVSAMGGKRPASINCFPATDGGWAGINMGWMSGPLAADSRTAPSTGTIPMVMIPMGTTGSGGSSGDAGFQDIIAGNVDSYITGTVQDFINAGYKDIIVRPGWEMDIGGWPWSVDSSSAGDFVAAFQHIYTLMKNQASSNGVNIRIFYGPQVPSQASGTDAQGNLYPGDAYCDIIGTDMYDFGEDQNALASIAQFAVAHGKPFGFGECGVGTVGNTSFFANVANTLSNIPGIHIAVIVLYDDSPSWASSASGPAFKAMFDTLAAYP